MTTIFKIEDFVALPARLTNKPCARCIALERTLAGIVKPVIAVNDKHEYICSRCADELAFEQLDSLFEPIEPVHVEESFRAPAHMEMPEIYCSRCTGMAAWTSRKKLGDQGYDLCQSCHGMLLGGVRGTLLT